MNESPPAGVPDATVFDGGETGCGELLLDLLVFMKRQAPGSLVNVRSLDAGAPLEIPAWCRLTGHTLINAAHPFYLLRTTPSES
jgi:tRNA 2-thiouridine synthesizing protein A